VNRDDVDVANGLFTTTLDFGPVFAGNKRWLEIAVRPGASTGTYTLIAPQARAVPASRNWRARPSTRARPPAAESTRAPARAAPAAAESIDPKRALRSIVRPPTRKMRRAHRESDDLGGQ
jgi:hypothetical protein